ncbi:MAG: NUDIX domain-containing protein [Deltaproteobacteria bacterium]|nr:NUDIX domain-containing protein [Deltaproteobacteria bacterium]
MNPLNPEDAAVEKPPRPLVGVGAVIFNATTTQVLLIRRGHAPAEGHWSVPGGMVERGEMLAVACAREVEEETGLRVKVHAQPVKIIERVIQQDTDVAYHYLIIDFLAEVMGGELQANDDAAAVEWVPMADLKGRLTTAGLEEMLERAKQVAVGEETRVPLLSQIDTVDRSH